MSSVIVICVSLWRMFPERITLGISVLPNDYSVVSTGEDHVSEAQHPNNCEYNCSSNFFGTSKPIYVHN